MDRFDVLTALSIGFRLECHRGQWWYAAILELRPVPESVALSIVERGHVSLCEQDSKLRGVPCYRITEAGRRWLWRIRECACE